MTVVLGSSDPVSAAMASSLDVPVVDIDSPIPPGSDGVVIVVGSNPSPELTNANATAELDWSRLAEAPMQRTLRALQRAHGAMCVRGGRIVLVLPTIGMAGAARSGAVHHGTGGNSRDGEIRCATMGFGRHSGQHGRRAAATLRAHAWPASAAHLTAPAVDDDSGLIEAVVEATKFLLRQDIRSRSALPSSPMADR